MEAGTNTPPEAIIRTLHKQANVALSQGDLESVMAVYSDDVISMPPNQPPLHGKAAVRSMWESVLEGFSIDSTVSVEEVEVAGAWAFERGTYKMTLKPKGGGELIEDEGKYLDIVRQQPDGDWKYARVSWSSSRPAS